MRGATGRRVTDSTPYRRSSSSVARSHLSRFRPLSDLCSHPCEPWQGALRSATMQRSGDMLTVMYSGAGIFDGHPRYLMRLYALIIDIVTHHNIFTI